MPPLSFDAVAEYLSRLFESPVRVLSLAEQSKKDLGGDLKTSGYGTPVFLEFEIGGKIRKAVLETMSPSSVRP